VYFTLCRRRHNVHFMCNALATVPSQHGQHRLRRFVTVALAFTGAVTVPIAIGLVWSKQPIILFLFGSKYPLASRPLTVLVVGMTLYGFSLVLENLWVGLGHPRIAAIASGLAMVSTVSLGLILIPHIADMGAAIACAAGAAAQLAVIGSFTVWVLYSGSIMRTQSFPDQGILES
jgi:O-antigen/teichoic acid export membrane protein